MLCYPLNHFFFTIVAAFIECKVFMGEGSVMVGGGQFDTFQTGRGTRPPCPPIILRPWTMVTACHLSSSSWDIYKKDSGSTEQTQFVQHGSGNYFCLTSGASKRMTSCRRSPADSSHCPLPCPGEPPEATAPAPCPG
ncbi:hypothetical protein SKAU_G00386370 [Synaphobranchus kaupii]|uniref:Uncharacterized protein n=1 Tax=Synaphobranchus kaupii TaxID=118154 RepID=A0A9Q1EEP2_SYNKA|nr:hypothetical protein SKAU_G00386370 [Synaphobranchus kaupii]